MIRFRLAAAAFALIIGVTPGLAQTAPTTAPAPAQADVDAAIARVAPSLVRIHVVTITYAGGREMKREASGSGTIITPEGHVVMHDRQLKQRSRCCTTSAVAGRSFSSMSLMR